MVKPEPVCPSVQQQDGRALRTCTCQVRSRASTLCSPTCNSPVPIWD